MTELLKRLSAGIVLITIYYIFNQNMINQDALAYYENRKGKAIKIYDIGHKYIQDLSNNPYAKYLCDAFVVLSTIIAYLVFSISAFTELMALQYYLITAMIRPYIHFITSLWITIMTISLADIWPMYFFFS
jgi:hypothetical protein